MLHFIYQIRLNLRKEVYTAALETSVLHWCKEFLPRVWPTLPFCSLVLPQSRKKPVTPTQCLALI